LVAGIVGAMLGLVEAWHQKDQAELARNDQAKLLVKTEWMLYGSQINLAQQAWESHESGLALHHLDATRPDLRRWEYDYLYTLFYSNQRTYGNDRTFREEFSPVYTVAVSPDGQRIVSGGGDGKVNVWDAATGKRALTFGGHKGGYKGGVESLAVSPDGKRIACVSGEGTGNAW